MKIEYRFESVADFYRNADILTPTGIPSQFNDFNIEKSTYLKPSFIGLPINSIYDHRFKYTETMEKIFEAHKLDFFKQKSSKKVIKWSYEEGKLFDEEKFIEDLPYLKNVKRVEGKKRKDRFININVNLATIWYITPKQMIWKGITTAYLTKYLISNGFKVKIILYDTCKDIGYLKGDKINQCIFKITLKKYEDPINLPLLLTTISPWFLRYWRFKFCTGHFNVSEGQGRVISFIDFIDHKLPRINIDSNECLSKEEMERKIEELKKEKIIM